MNLEKGVPRPNKSRRENFTGNENRNWTEIHEPKVNSLGIG